MTGKPHAIASTSTIPKPSKREVKANIDDEEPSEEIIDEKTGKPIPRPKKKKIINEKGEIEDVEEIEDEEPSEYDEDDDEDEED